MNRYYFHLWTGHDYEIDETGVEMESAEAACLEAFHGAREIFMEMLRDRRNTTGYRFDIFDDQGRCLHEVSFAEALGRRVTKKTASFDCVELVNRGHTLAADLAREITFVKANLQTSRDLIAKGAKRTQA